MVWWPNGKVQDSRGTGPGFETCLPHFVSLSKTLDGFHSTG